MEDISFELNDSNNSYKYKQIFFNNNKIKKKQDEMYYNYFNNIENSIITRIFYSQIISIIKCQCGYESYSFQKYLDFPLKLPLNKSKISLYEVLDFNLGIDNVEYEVPCEKCLKIREHKKLFKFTNYL